MTYAKRTDANQSAIVKALRKEGYKVYLTHRVGFGFPDLLCVSKSHIAVLLEVKDGNDGLNENEQIFFAEYPAPHRVVCSPEQAILTMEIYDEMRMG